MKEAIYFVWCPTNGEPTVRHPDINSARTEARRLCQQHPEQEVFVLRAVESVRYSATPFICKTFCKR